jgi:hypothetical protein
MTPRSWGVFLGMVLVGFLGAAVLWKTAKNQGYREATQHFKASAPSQLKEQPETQKKTETSEAAVLEASRKDLQSEMQAPEEENLSPKSEKTAEKKRDSRVEKGDVRREARRGDNPGTHVAPAPLASSLKENNLVTTESQTEVALKGQNNTLARQKTALSALPEKSKAVPKAQPARLLQPSALEDPEAEMLLKKIAAPAPSLETQGQNGATASKSEKPARVAVGAVKFQEMQKECQRASLLDSMPPAYCSCEVGEFEQLDCRVSSAYQR